MRFKILPYSGKAAWQNNKPFLWFLLSLLLVHLVLKIIFYQYNLPLLFTGSQTDFTLPEKFKILQWSITEDILLLLIINTPLLLLLAIGHLAARKISPRFNIPLGWILVPLFALLNSFALVLNLSDIFYFRFHFQRANADLFYVLDHPLNRLLQQPFYIPLLFFLLVAAIIFFMFRLHLKLFNSFIRGNNCMLITGILVIGLFVSLILKKEFSKLLVPNYPLVQLNANELPFVQNSFHTFLYSCYRKGEAGLQNNYMSNSEADSLLPLRKTLNGNPATGSKKNIVLFIMESVPYDFFDTASVYKVSMPFFDSLLQKSRFFSNAFCYAHESNKGITAILAGIPTLSDIPLYHSSHINMPVTPIGSALRTLNYQSMFCIGDEYDNFGFAKCANWLGFNRYYSMEDISGFKNLPAHSMGLQDEQVLNFFYQKINQQQSPFFAVHYNISTHFPYDIPETFSKGCPAAYTAPMKAMQYYDHSLQQFFTKAGKESWFRNTTFIFCSDHWLFPQGKLGPYTAASAYHIPIIIYNPSEPIQKNNGTLSSQFDIAATILAIAGYKDSVITYGSNLLDSNSHNSFVFSRVNNSLYQVADSSYILGFNTTNNKTEFLYNYKNDTHLSHNLSADKNASLIIARLQTGIRAFLQKAKMQYNNQPFK